MLSLDYRRERRNSVTLLEKSSPALEHSARSTVAHYRAVAGTEGGQGISTTYRAGLPGRARDLATTRSAIDETRRAARHVAASRQPAVTRIVGASKTNRAVARHAATGRTSRRTGAFEQARIGFLTCTGSHARRGS